jgi:hypothetical protein
MASKKTKVSKKDEKYAPKAAARHAKLAKSKQDEIDSFKDKIYTDKHLAKKYETERKAEIKELPKAERAAAKAELKESIAKRKEGEARDRETLDELIREERVEKKLARSDTSEDDEWVNGGKKKSSEKNEPAEKAKPSKEEPKKKSK